MEKLSFVRAYTCFLGRAMPALAILLAAASSLAGTYTVTNLADSGFGSLRYGIEDSPANTIINFQPGLTGTISLTGGELELSGDVTIVGPGPAQVSVSGTHQSRIFNVYSGTVAIYPRINNSTY
jgi:hypothetical protein